MKLIVRAVNSHAKLVSSLQKLKDNVFWTEENDLTRDEFEQMFADAEKAIEEAERD